MLELVSAHEEFFFWLTVASIVGFIASLVFIPWLVIQIPADYFSHKKRHKHRWHKHTPTVRFILIMSAPACPWGIKNIFGFIVLLAGIAMLILPG